MVQLQLSSNWCVRFWNHFRPQYPGPCWNITKARVGMACNIPTASVVH